MVDSITALRGIAAYLVVISHVQRVSEAYAGIPAPLRVFDLGTFGVTLFFVLSGFTLCLSWGDQPLRVWNLGAYVVRRWFRIYPAFLFSLPCYLLLHAVMVGRSWPDNSFLMTFLQPVDGMILLNYLLLVFNFTNDWFYINGIYWSLPVEFQFYLLFPLMIMLARRGIWLPCLAALGCVVVSWSVDSKALTFSLVWQFAAGVSAGRIFRRSADFRGLRAFWLAAPSLFALAVGVRWGWADLPTPDLFRLSGAGAVLFPGATSLYYGVIAVALVYAVAHLSVAGTGPASLVGRWLAAQGEVSYSVYLFHNLVILSACITLLEFGASGFLFVLGLHLVALPGTFLLSHITFRAVERPGIGFGRTIAERLLSPRQRFGGEQTRLLHHEGPTKSHGRGSRLDLPSRHG